MKSFRGVIWIAGAAVVLALVGLRVRDALRAPVVVPDAPATRPTVDIPCPTDYVLHPPVVAEEANSGPRRIISLAPSVTEILFALGMGDRIVGRTPYCHHPPQVESIETVGAIMDANLARIQALDADLVLATANSGRLIDGLNALGIRYESVPHASIGEIHTAIERIGQLCDRPKTAAALNAAIREDIAALTRQVADLDLPSREVMITLGPLPIPPQATWVAGPGLFLDELLRLAGQRNAVAGAVFDTQGELPLEKIVVLDPEVILEFREPVTTQAMSDLYTSWSRLGQMQAIEHQRVRSLGGKEWLSAGPRVAIELHQFVVTLASIP